ncbi:major facilitator superfamily domain-containing protein [Truncatella angustata]|uniref:Major facilitator superfamily domain-containing protein n=1 Tax=Truncatella angustata TaxID=152316 RepID=A0A9P8UI62_9PEZI|nr:major facilitator superfamily domain-containing protein [Truncatella angustata]KAH6652597.1 major facilitator superfamily domain-containing protein [Truncatella angustata]
MRRSLEKNDDIESVKQHDFQSQNETPPKVFNSKSIAFEESMSTAEVSADSKPQTSINGPEAPPVEPSIGNKGMESGNAFSWLRSITWIPERCRYDPENPPQFSLPMNMLLGLAGTFTVANLYYPQPILNILAEEFNVSFERASTVATLSQAGYAVGLLFLCPLGDKLRRRPFVLTLIWLTATVWLGLCLTNNFSVFIALSFICGVGTVTPQLMLPLVGDLAPPHKRASSLSIVVSGLALGMLIARVLSGILANFTSWRNIYWLSFGAQYLILILLYFFLPDYPAKDPDLSYFQLLWDIITMVVKEPLLLQACLIGFLLSAAFTSFWTTLTFLLASPPYSYSSLEIGFFAFIGIAVITLGPLWSRLITDRFMPLFSVILGLCFEIIGIVIGTFIGQWTVAGPIVQAITMDTGANFAHTANRTNVYNQLPPRMRNRVNTAYMVFSFAGQLTGTAVGNRLYAQGGWIWSGSCNIAFIGFGIILCFMRGPRETKWVGWRGGWNVRKDMMLETDEPTPSPERMAEEAGSVTIEGTAQRQEIKT